MTGMHASGFHKRLRFLLLTQSMSYLLSKNVNPASKYMHKPILLSCFGYRTQKKCTQFSKKKWKNIDSLNGVSLLKIQLNVCLCPPFTTTPVKLQSWNTSKIPQHHKTPQWVAVAPKLRNSWPISYWTESCFLSLQNGPYIRNYVQGLNLPRLKHLSWATLIRWGGSWASAGVDYVLVFVLWNQ